MSYKRQDMHTSYHADGNKYVNWLGQKPTKMGTGPPLSNFKGLVNLSSMSFSSDVSGLHDTPLYRLKKTDAVVYVDTRVYPKGIGCNVWIVEPRRIDLLEKIVKPIPGAPPSIRWTECHAFFNVKPWICLVLWGNVHRN